MIWGGWERVSSNFEVAVPMELIKSKSGVP